MFADNVLGPVKQWGFLVRDLDEYARCAAEAAEWDGSDPYRLFSF